MKFRQIKETCLYVTDLEQTRAFYEDQLGLPLIGLAEGRHVFFHAGTSVLLCFLPEITRKDDKLPPHYGFGKMHLAFECEQPDYEAWKSKIADAGIAIIQEAEWRNGLKSFYFRDPDNHLLEIVEIGIWGD
jgi:catechol 2,3-dioxygenase-like lactoylglutathione lyase family enzyme